MKSAIVLVAMLAVAGAALFVLSAPAGVGLPGGLLMTGDKGYIHDRTLEFLEDIKFKDFEKASSYHLEEAQEARDIPALIRRVFRIKHELLDIHDYEILDVELDSKGQRGRVRTLVRYHVLGDRKVRDDPDAQRSTEMMFYWFEQPDGTWTMELESSLR